MKYLKAFESVNYNDKHFGVPVFEYFPWYKYPKSITELPEINEPLYRLYQSVLPSKFGTITSSWVAYDQGNGFYTTITRGFDASKCIYVNSAEEEISTPIGRHTIEDWEDIEKVRLMCILGRKSDAIEYLNFLKSVEELTEFTDYDKENNPNDYESYRITTFEDLMQRGEILNLRKNITDDQVISFISNYNGDESFFQSLRTHYEKYGKLSPKQISASKKTVGMSLANLNKNKICLVINRGKINQPIVVRLQRKGFTVMEMDNDIIVFKP